VLDRPKLEEMCCECYAVPAPWRCPSGSDLDGRIPQPRRPHTGCSTATTPTVSSNKAPAQLSLRGCDPRLCVASGYLAAAGGLLITTSTRRFCCRPEAESLAATGSLSPLPDAESRVEPIPCAVRYDRTDSARRSDNLWL
jgi:hypothetical protein